MAIRRKPTPKANVKDSAAAIQEATEQRWLQGFLLAAYVLDAVEMLPPEKKEKLDSLELSGIPSWRKAVEEDYGINRTFVRNVYGFCTEIKQPADAIVFILQGIGAPDVVQSVSQVLGLDR